MKIKLKNPNSNPVSVKSEQHDLDLVFAPDETLEVPVNNYQYHYLIAVSKFFQLELVNFSVVSDDALMIDGTKYDREKLSQLAPAQLLELATKKGHNVDSKLTSSELIDMLLPVSIVEIDTTSASDNKAKEAQEAEQRKKAQAEAEAKLKAENEAKAKADAEKKAQADADAKRKTDEEAKKKADAEAEAKRKQEEAIKALAEQAKGSESK